MQKSKSLSNFEVISIRNIIRDGHLDLVENLFFQGHFDIDYKDENGNTMLNYAISFDKKNIVQFLLDSGINPNTVNIFHFTPLQEAIHLKRTDIVILLRNHGACFKHKQDCDQIIFGTRADFFEKISLIIDILFSISPYCVHFFHNTYNSDYLFACSICKTITPSFSDFLSNFIFMKDNFLFSKHAITKSEIRQEKELHFLLPFVDMYHIKKIYIIPLRLHQITLGYFFAFSPDENFSLKNSQDKKDFFSKILQDDFLNCKEMSPVVYHTLVTNSLFQKYLKITLASVKEKYSNYDLYLRLLKWIDLCKSFWCLLKEKQDYWFFQIIENLLYIKEFITPHGKFKKIRYRISELTQQLVTTNIICQDEFIHSEESHLFKMMKDIEYPYESPIKNSSIENHDNDTQGFNSYELFNITGVDLEKTTIVQLNKVYEDFLHNVENLLPYLKRIYFCLCQDKNICPKLHSSVRDSVVSGIIHEYQDTFYLPPQEINDALEYLENHVKKDENIFHQFYHFYFCVLHFIHPFQDGNGKSCRIFLNFFLKSRGISKTICKQSSTTFLLFSDFCRIVLESQKNSGCTDT